MSYGGPIASQRPPLFISKGCADLLYQLLLDTDSVQRPKQHGLNQPFDRGSDFIGPSMRALDRYFARILDFMDDSPEHRGP